MRTLEVSMLREVARVSHAVCRSAAMATKMELELSAPMGITVHRFFPLGVKNASLARESSSKKICQ